MAAGHNGKGDAKATTRGAPTATESIDGKYLPPPPPPFGGEINLSAEESKPFWPPKVVPPEGAPNVLLIMTDDAGYGLPSTFGGVVPTPALDRVAKAGLRYNQFHSTALCSPTRAALITGRNHHSVGFGVITEQSTGYPGYDSIIGPENATIGAILKHNGYATSWFGKEHNTPSFHYSVAGPFDQWPVGWASNTSTDSWVVKPISGGHTCSATRRRFSRGSDGPTITRRQCWAR
jgi:Sulfatase